MSSYAQSVIIWTLMDLTVSQMNIFTPGMLIYRYSIVSYCKYVYYLSYFLNCFLTKIFIVYAIQKYCSFLLQTFCIEFFVVVFISLSIPQILSCLIIMAFHCTTRVSSVHPLIMSHRSLWLVRQSVVTHLSDSTQAILYYILT